MSVAVLPLSRSMMPALIDHDPPMKIFDINFRSCGASYEAAESTSVKGTPGDVLCAIRGGRLACWNEPRARVYRLVVAQSTNIQMFLHRHPAIKIVIKTRKPAIVAASLVTGQHKNREQSRRKGADPAG